MKKTVVILIVVTVISKILGFARDVTLSYFYGATIISDVYLISLTIPIVILSIIGKGIYTGFVPMYTRIEKKNGTVAANNYTNNITNLVLVICTIIFIIGILFTKYIVKLFASGFVGEDLELAVTFTRIHLLGVYFSGLIYVFTSYLQTKELFIIQAVMGLPANLIYILSFIIGSKTSVYALPIGSLIATGSQFVLFYMYAYKSHFRYKFRLDYKDRNIRKMITLTLPVIVGASVLQINVLVDRSIASYIAVGGISALNYANTINLMVLGTVVSAIITVLYPKISKMAVENKMTEMKNNVLVGINAINIFVLPITVGYMVFAQPIVQVLYGRGVFDAHAIEMTTTALFYYSIGLIGFSLQDILSNVFYSLQDTKTPMITAVGIVIVNVVLNFTLSKFLGIGGLALATSISMLLAALILFMKLRKKIGSFGTKNILVTLCKTILASVVMGVLSQLAFELVSSKFSLPFSLFVSVVWGVMIYSVAISLMKIKEVKIILTVVKKRISTTPIYTKLFHHS